MAWSTITYSIGLISRPSPKLKKWRLTAAVFAASVLAATAATTQTNSPSGGPDASGNNQPYKAQFLFKGQYGGSDLAVALKELGNLKDQREAGTVDYSKILKMPDSQIKSANDCLKTVRSDPSGKLFDTARCVNVWPSEDKAPTPILFENAFAVQVAKSGAEGLPAVKVSTFPFSLTLQPSQIPSDNMDCKYRQSTDGKMEPCEAAVTYLCNPKVTFLPRDKCQVAVTRVPTTGQVFFHVSQTAYLMESTQKMTRPAAQALAARVKKAVLATHPERRPGEAPDTTIFWNTTPIGPPGGSSQSTPSGNTAVSTGDGSEDFDRVWERIHTTPEQIELKSPNPNRLQLHLFDRSAMQVALPLSDWYGNLTNKLKNLTELNPKCQWSDTDPWHTDASSSLFFPESVGSSVKAYYDHKPDDGQMRESVWSGFIMSMAHFDGDPVFASDDQSGSPKVWYVAGALDASPQPLPSIGVAVFAEDHLTDTDADPRAANAVDGYLSLSTKTLLVVSAPAKASVTNGGNFSRTRASRIDRGTVIDNCKGTAWPACLGIHPRVLVVAPTKPLPQDASRSALFNPDKYVLGASTVKLGAPGDLVPVVSPCAVTGSPNSPADDRWTIHAAVGTSFSAPIVGAVLARILRVGGSRVADQPEAAIWRVLATADSISSEAAGIKPDDLVAFGQIDVDRALKGASESEAGQEGQAVIYPARSGDKREQPRYAVVSPFPWNDSFKNIELARGANPLPGLRRYLRGVLPYANGTTSDALDFSRVLRIVRRTEDRFDIYYLIGVDNLGTLSVDVLRNVRLGSLAPMQGARGYCRIDGETFPGATAAQDAEPACLYEWNPGDDKASFEPLDLRKIDEIVLPLMHPAYPFVREVDPSKIREVMTSPWRSAYCKTGPRQKAKPLLTGITRELQSQCETVR